MAELDDKAWPSLHLGAISSKNGGSLFDQVVDSGARQQFDTGSVRDSRDGKGRFDLIPGYPLYRLARHFENGAVKYGDRNWEKGQDLSRYQDSAFRHLIKLIAGATDEDHAAAVIWNIMAFMETQERIRQGKLPTELDNLPEGGATW